MGIGDGRRHRPAEGGAQPRPTPRPSAVTDPPRAMEPERKALDTRQVRRYLRVVADRGSARDAVVALLPLCAGLRVDEIVRLDVADVRLWDWTGVLRVRGEGMVPPRELPLARFELRTAVADWLAERPLWPGAGAVPALLLTDRGRRLSDRSARTIITGIGAEAELGNGPGVDGGPGGLAPHTLRLTFHAQLAHAGRNPVPLGDAERGGRELS